ncbi:hypothetical protein F5Y16DRAFT_316694 [Xylariaceae sp. FL0255]|nr:hypothetical protein F5Y16DRAFT_316694 [Xylariaceae sp. FL0255]
MTERPPPVLTQTTPSQAAVISPQSAPAIPNHVPIKTQTSVEEEPYTIKCICDFIDDDGNTIYCDVCDTWQHIECYYPFNNDEVGRDDFNHACTDCKPRDLDRQRANERQSLRQNRLPLAASSERKATKRLAPKNQRKKSKPADIGTGGHSGSENNSKTPHDSIHTHQHKKSKSTHRPSQSVSSQAPKRSPSYGQKSANPHGHPPSPATTPPDLPLEFDIQNYSSGFMNLYRDDHDVAIVQTNSFASLIISNLLSGWLRDPDKFRKDIGHEFKDVVEDLSPEIDSIRAYPQVRSKKLPAGSEDAVHCQYLIAPDAVKKNTPLIELNGQIGIQNQYCEDPANRYQELSSPLPFVFFLSSLPLYIDTRKEGSKARYVRRSCKPNAVLDNFLSDGSEYHFWLVSDRDLKANEQITIPWDHGLSKDIGSRWEHLIGLDGSEKQPEFNEKEIETYQSIANWVHSILTEYGGCACDLGPECAFARFHRTYISRPQLKETGSKKKPRKPARSNVSPTSTGQATNSRAPSEGRMDEGAENDSGSSRSKPPSRDMTPAPRQGSFDTLGVLTELTDRDKRKVQMVEDSFRRMEQQQPPRKKKRTSDGATSTTNSSTKPKTKATATNPNMPNGSSERRYVDAGTSGSNGGSPTSAVSPTATTMFGQANRRKSVSAPPRKTSAERPVYCDAAVQTDPVEDAWFSVSKQSPKPKKRVVSLSKRLLASRHRLKADEDECRKSAVASPTSVTSALVKMDLKSPSAEASPKLAEPSTMIGTDASTASMSEDVVMADAPATPNGVTVFQTSPASHVNKDAKVKSPQLRVQLPPVPAFGSTMAALSTSTPMSNGCGIVQSPFSANNLPSPFLPSSVNSGTVQPSPVKKKLSLSDYTKSRMNKANAAKSSAASLKPPIAITEEARSPSNPDVTMADSPINEKSTEA